MKKFNILIAIACCCMLASCTDEFRQIQGEYSYKASGTAALDTATIALPNEIGALQVIDGKDGTLMLTFMNSRSYLQLKNEWPFIFTYKKYIRSQKLNKLDSLKKPR